jgi:hypothetical protein
MTDVRKAWRLSESLRRSRHRAAVPSRAPIQLSQNTAARWLDAQSLRLDVGHITQRVR